MVACSASQTTRRNLDEGESVGSEMFISQSLRIWLILTSLTLLLALTSACATPTPKPTPTLTLLERLDAMPTSTPSPVRSVAQVNSSWPTSKFMDNKHLSKGIQCTSCHNSMPPQGPPKSEVCLGCHGGSYSALAEKTVKVNPNPHKSHLGEIACTECHRSHDAFRYYCKECHSEYSNDRFN